MVCYPLDVAYNDLTIDDLSQRFGLNVVEARDLFGAAPPVAIGAHLAETLREHAPLALAMSTEKARSEMIIAPILLEARRLRGGAVSLFSGMEFSVDPARGLNGFCDFLFSLSARQISIEAPVLAVVEAKNENIRQGIPQCIGEMYAARLFNERRGGGPPVVFGAVTTGNVWRFVRLRGENAEVDLAEYYLHEVERIVGVLVEMLAIGARSIHLEPTLAAARS